MVIVVTDEVGDDEQRLEDAITQAQKAKVPVYVLGSQAHLRPGRGITWTTSTPRPSTSFADSGAAGARKRHARADPAPVLVRRSAVRDRRGGLRPVCPQPAGQPPRAGSISSPGSTPAAWGSTRPGCENTSPTGIRRDQYETQIAHSPFRQAVFNAAQITQQKLPGMPSLYFPPADAPEFKDVMAANQGVAERTAYTVDEALGPINAVAKLRDRETSRRWQAHYDLIRGRLLAMKVRCYEYNWACAG